MGLTTISKLPDPSLKVLDDSTSDRFHYPLQTVKPGVAIRVIAIANGKMDLFIPEIGVQTVSSGEWVLLSDFGADSTAYGSEVKGFTAVLPMDGLHDARASGVSLPARLSCLVCPRRDAAFYVKGTCCGRLSFLAGELSSGVSRCLSSLWMRQSYLAEFVSRVLARPELQASPGCRSCCCGKDLDSVKGVADFLRQNLGDEHSITSLARTFHLNECKLKKGFKEHFRETVFGFLRRVRMEKAWELLNQGEVTVLEVANAVGYSNPSHFARAFRDVHALNPREVRQLKV